jgi:hypothetical protein
MDKGIINSLASSILMAAGNIEKIMHERTADNPDYTQEQWDRVEKIIRDCKHSMDFDF